MTDARAATVARLRAAGCVEADAEAGQLLADAPDASALDARLARREQGEPLAWIVGRVGFGDLTLRITPGVYVPRPHSLELARRAVAHLPGGGRALDLCTGSGAIGAYLRHHAAPALVVGVDRDPHAAACARSNGVTVVVGDLAAPVGGDGTWDVVTAVAPYVPTGELRFLPADVQRYEPRVALDGGADGLDQVRRVVEAGGRLLRRGGRLVTEIGGAQARRLLPSLGAHGFGDVTIWDDDDGDARGITAVRTG
jgi:release factor glutamine methyltransferase